MKSELIKTDKFSFITFDDIFCEEELYAIWHEATFLSSESKLKKEKDIGAAMENGQYLKQGQGVFLDTVYRERSTSNYLQLYKKPFDSKIINEYKEQDYTLNLFNNTNHDVTLMSYLSDTDYYKPHIDRFCYTYVFWMYQEPKAFTGGDFYFPDVDCNITIASNSGVLFPSWARHGVNTLTFSKERKQYDGRFSFSTFFSFGTG